MNPLDEKIINVKLRQPKKCKAKLRPIRVAIKKDLNRPFFFTFFRFVQKSGHL